MVRSVRPVAAPRRGRRRSAAPAGVGGRSEGDRGAAIVEFVLVMPFLVALLLAIVSSGVTFDRKLSLTTAAREAARFGAAVPPDQGFANGQSWAANVRSVARARAAGELNDPAATVCVALVEGSADLGNLRTYSAAGYPVANYTTEAGGFPCDRTENYPVTAYDTGRRVQVRLTRPGRIEAGLMSWSVTLSAFMSVKSESG